MAKKSSSSRRWLKEHFSDPYVKKAQQEGYRARAVYKLIEIQERDHLFKPGMLVVDLGAAPGSWSQVISKWVQPKGAVIAMDLLPMDEIEGVTFFQGDFAEDEMLEKLLSEIGERKIDWVVSDIAPNMSGNPGIDMPRAMYLSELVLDFALRSLKTKGGLLIKAFQGEKFDAFLTDIRKKFKTVAIRKPKASRGRSREVYILAREFRK